jgi:hypothetical protein
LALLGAGIAFAALPGTAFGAKDHLACKLTPHHLVKGVFDLPNVDYFSSASSPTAPPPDNHVVDGADESRCLVRAYSHPASPAHFGLPQKFHVARCCGLIQVETLVQDQGPDGDPYDVQKVWNTEVHAAIGLEDEFGGGGVPAPSISDSSKEFGFWYGSQQIAVLGYLVNDSTIEIEVHAHRNADHKALVFARHIVPAFEPYS